MVSRSHPKMPYCISRWGAFPNMIKNEDPPLSGGPPLAMETIPSRSSSK